MILYFLFLLALLFMDYGQETQGIENQTRSTCTCRLIKDLNLDILLTCNKYVSTKCSFSCFGIYNSINLFLHTFWFSDTPSRMYYLHTCCWVLNMFGIFFILAAHEHYSIDVVIAFYISSRLFLYYHTLANTRALKCIDSKRTRVWFPLFWFFEEKVSGKVPNEYEWPLKWPSFLCSKSKCQ